MTSNAQPAFTWHERKRHCAGCLSEGGNTRKLAARAPCRAGCYLSMHYGSILYRQNTFSFGARPWCDMRPVTSNTQLAFAWHPRKRNCAGCLSGGGEPRNLVARERHAALVEIGPRTMERPVWAGGLSSSM